MDKSELIRLTDEILNDSKTAILSTVTPDGEPRMRWMSPIFIRNYQDHIYAVTSKKFSKVNDIAENSNVQWMIQDKSLNRIITLNGQVSIIENQSLKTEVLEDVGRQLRTFWTINSNPSSVVVLETLIKSAMYFEPVEGKKTLISFD